MIKFMTPDGVYLRLEVASLMERAFSLSVDILIILFATIVSALGLLAAGGSGLPWAAIGILMVFALRYGYFLFFEFHLHGATPGKRLLGLRVMERSGGQLEVRSLVARNLMRDLELTLPLAALVAPEGIIGNVPWWLKLLSLSWIGLMIIVPMISSENLRIGDLVAGTVVVRVPNAPLLTDHASVATSIRFARSQLSFYGERELDALADILRQIEKHKLDHKEMQVIAQTVARKISYSGPEPFSKPGLFLRSFYRAQRAQLEEHLLYGKRKGSKVEDLSSSEF